MGMRDFFMDVIVGVHRLGDTQVLTATATRKSSAPKPALNLLLYLLQFPGVDFTF